MKKAKLSGSESRKRKMAGDMSRVATTCKSIKDLFKAAASPVEEDIALIEDNPDDCVVSGK